MGILKIKSLEYDGDNYYYKSPEFESGLNIILGNNGSGKTTFCDLLYYALGGDVYQFKKDSSEPHREIISDTNNYVELKIYIDNTEYSLKRKIGDNNISIKYTINKKDIFEYYPIYRNNQSPYIFSDWLLKHLQIKNIKLYDGYRSYIINIKDLIRLIYHDQNTNPQKIYKNPNRDDFIQNSEFIRKVIFELLMGENYDEYYEAMNNFRSLEVKRTQAKSVLDDYRKIVEEIRKDCSIEYNVKFAIENLHKNKKLLEQYLIHREAIKNNLNKTNYDEQIYSLRQKLVINEDNLQIISDKIKFNELEIISMRDIERTTDIEIKQLKKIIYTNEQMSIFAFNTCPWCLKELPEQKDKDMCYCGNKIEEDEKIIFEYNTDEYKTILKSKMKSLETITQSINDILLENNELYKKRDLILCEYESIKNKIKSYLKEYNNPINFQTIDYIDNKISITKNEISQLEEYIKTEQKLEDLTQQYEYTNNQYQQQKLLKDKLENEAKLDIYSKINSFNFKYKELMTNSLEDCKTASIDIDDYMPIIDDGCYKEKSASVHTRLMYFYTLLYMSLKYKNIKFPHFLLIDTPDTNGIDTNNLKRAILQLKNTEISGIDYQVILTTSDFPEEYKDCVKEHIIKKQNYLLKKKKS